LDAKGRKPTNHVGTITFGGTVDLTNTHNPGLIELVLEIASGP
jgi:hypothetical protein